MHDNIDWKEIVCYDESSPSKLIWKIDRGNGVKAGDFTGTLHPILGYWMFSFSKNGKTKMFYCHRVIWELFNGPLGRGLQIDHKDIDRSNNLIDNLRAVTRKRNLRNSRKSSRNTSGITGVFLYKNYWIAHWVTLEGKKKSKSFSVIKLGNDKAKEAAIIFREQKIEELNIAGAGYTEKHGK